MRSRAMLLAAALTGLTGGDGLRAQDAGPCPGMYPSPQVGDYAEMRFKSPDQGNMPVRFAVVGTREVVGRTHYWIEIFSVPPTVGDTVIVQLLVPTYPFEPHDLRGYIVKMPGQAATRFPDYMIPQLSQSAPGPGWKEQCQSADDLGNERINVPAGVFIARHYRSQPDNESVWIANVPFGMVKMVTAAGEMELMAFGSDAQSYITEEPVEYEPPGG